MVDHVSIVFYARAGAVRVRSISTWRLPSGDLF